MTKILQLRIGTSLGQAIQPDKEGKISLKPNQRVVLISAAFTENQADGSPCRVELSCAQEHGAYARFIPWRNPAISFAAFLLNSLVTENRKTYRLEGSDGTPASALYHLVRQHETEKNEPTWLQLLFRVNAGSNELQRCYFEATHNNATHTYSVKLRANVWDVIRLEVLSGLRKLPATCYASLAEHILWSFSKRPDAQPNPLLDVLVYDSTQGDYASVQQFHAVRFRSALKIAINPERRAHFYVIWIDSRRQDHSIYPFADWNWSLPAKDHPLESPVILPVPKNDDPPQAFFVDTFRGIECVVLIQRDSPLSPTQVVELRSEIKTLASLQPIGPPPLPCGRLWPTANESAPATRLVLGPAPESDSLKTFLDQLVVSLVPFATHIAVLVIPNEGENTQ